MSWIGREGHEHSGTDIVKKSEIFVVQDDFFLWSSVIWCRIASSVSMSTGPKKCYGCSPAILKRGPERTTDHRKGFLKDIFFLGVRVLECSFCLLKGDLTVLILLKKWGLKMCLKTIEKSLQMHVVDPFFTPQAHSTRTRLDNNQFSDTGRCQTALCPEREGMSDN